MFGFVTSLKQWPLVALNYLPMLMLLRSLFGILIHLLLLQTILFLLSFFVLKTIVCLAVYLKECKLKE